MNDTSTTPKQTDTSQTVKCPQCLAEAVYKYGKNKKGKQRYLCLVCNKQFVPGVSRAVLKERPSCPNCSKPMSIYMKDTNTIRFRCKDYPRCKTYLKLNKPPA